MLCWFAVTLRMNLDDLACSCDWVDILTCLLVMNELGDMHSHWGAICGHGSRLLMWLTVLELQLVNRLD